MTRLLQAMAGGPQGGAELHFARLAVALARAGLEQRIVTRPNAARDAMLRAGGIEPVHARFGGAFDLWTRHILARAIRDFRPEIVLSYMSRATAAIPAGDFVHVARLGGYYDLKYYRRCDHLVTITHGIAEHLAAHGWPRSQVTVIANFVEDRAGVASAPRARYDTPEGAPLVLALGRLHRNKAFDVLLAAMARIEGAHLWLAGEGPERAALEAQAARLGIAARVRFLGWIDDPAPLFEAADVFAVPSRHEPLGSVLIEGWMHRAPMVAAASEGPREILRDGETALMVAVDDADVLAQAVTRLTEDRTLAARLATAGRKAYEAGYTEAVAVKSYLDLFDRLCAERRKGAA